MIILARLMTALALVFAFLYVARLIWTKWLKQYLDKESNEDEA